MSMTNMPEVTVLGDGGKTWEYRFENFFVKAYVPANTLPGDVINYGFKAPYLLVFEENRMTMEEAVSFAKKKGFEEIAARYDSSVLFVYPTAKGGWKNASPEIFKEIVAESKIHQYFKDGVVTMRDRFTGEFNGFFIRGAIFRTYLYGFGESADYIAENCMKTINGAGLWGPADVTPAVVTLCGLTKPFASERRDMPIISVGNSPEINKALKESSDYFTERSEEDFVRDFKEIVVRHRRWVGNLEAEPQFDEIGMVEEPGVAILTTSGDNRGDDRDTTRHKVGYMAYYNKGIMDSGKKVPLLLAFHGGGDSSFYITFVSGWWEVAREHDFLLVAIENHLNSTATEMMELIEHLKKIYNVDTEKIYASGFSMGGCKSWDMFQEYPGVFAALAPMDATFEVGLNVFGQPAPVEINKDIPVPVFYCGGEITPLPELPFQADKCHDRIRYLFEVNRIKKPYDVKFEDKENWPNKIWGISGDITKKVYDPSRDATLTIELFKNEAGVVYAALGSISGQGHECRHHTCEQAYRYMSQFRRLPDGSIVGGEHTEDLWKD